MNIPSLAAVSTGLSMTNTRGDIGISLLKQQFDQIEQVGEDLQKMMSESTIDVKI